METQNEPRQDPTPEADAEDQPNQEEGRRDNGGADSEEESASGSAAGANELSETRDRLLRLAAEFDNYRKRVERERAESWTRAQAQLAERLLDPLDDLQRLTSADPASLSTESVIEGMSMVERKLFRALESAGLEPLEAEGERFDPSIHEALGTVSTEDQESDDSVADVFQRGYRFKGTLLRPARVRVHRYEG